MPSFWPHAGKALGVWDFISHFRVSALASYSDRFPTLTYFGYLKCWIQHFLKKKLDLICTWHYLLLQIIWIASNFRPPSVKSSSKQRKKYMELLLVILCFLLPWALIPISHGIISKLFGTQYWSNDCPLIVIKYFSGKKYLYNKKVKEVDLKMPLWKMKWLITWTYSQWSWLLKSYTEQCMYINSPL